MLLVLYGPAGVGKTTLGSRLARELGVPFYDADCDLLPEMRECIAAGRLFSQDLRDQYTEVVVMRMREHLAASSDLIVAQALIKRENRKRLQAQFPEAHFVHIAVDRDVALARIAARADVVTPDFAGKIWDAFESSPEDQVIDNVEESTAMQRLHACCQSFAL